ncbi:MAG: 2-hydroxyacyl-CoA dehydratase family protein [Pseudomonadota bacterium]
MKEIRFFYDTLADLPSLAEQIKQTNTHIIGYLCSYVPEELILAAGFHPMRLFPSHLSILLADNHLQSYCCSPVKGILEDSLAGRLDFLYGIVFPQTCDTIQRLSDIWRLNSRYTFFADLIWPVKLNTVSSYEYVMDILKRFKQELETVSDKPVSDSDLKSAIKITNSIRDNISRLYQLKASFPETLASNDLYTIIKGSMIMDRTSVARHLPVIVKNLKKKIKLKKKKTMGHTGKRIIISGSMCDFPALVRTIETAGGFIVGDDFCTGQRWFDHQIETDHDPLAAIAQRYINRMSCPAKHTSLNTRKDQVLMLVENLKADGVVFLLTKFCDPHAFDYPYIKTVLDSKNIKNICIEIDDPGQGSGQISTRMETFIQMI